jgi:hypothetical protein
MKSCTLTIQYAGIIALRTQSLTSGFTGEALLVDVGRTKARVKKTGKLEARAEHFPLLTVEMVKWIKGAVPDLANAQPVDEGGRDPEYGIYRLDGCTVKFRTDEKQRFSPNFGAVTSIAPPADVTDMESLLYMADLKALSGSGTIRRGAPIACRVPTLVGKVKALATQSSADVDYSFGKVTKKNLKRVLATRFVQTIKFQKFAAIDIWRGGKKRTLRFGRPDDGTTNINAIISNACPCPEYGPQDHFNAYYELLSNPAQTPQINGTTSGQHPLTDPENCVVTLIRD